VCGVVLMCGLLHELDEFCGYIYYKPSRDLTRPLGLPRGLKDLLHMSNATVITYGSGIS
jgi:hypothetical protein